MINFVEVLAFNIVMYVIFLMNLFVQRERGIVRFCNKNTKKTNEFKMGLRCLIRKNRKTTHIRRGRFLLSPQLNDFSLLIFIPPLNIHFLDNRSLQLLLSQMFLVLSVSSATKDSLIPPWGESVLRWISWRVFLHFSEAKHFS